MGQEYSQPRSSLIRSHTLHKIMATRFPCTLTVIADSMSFTLSVSTSSATITSVLTQISALYPGPHEICALRTHRHLDLLDYWLLQPTKSFPPLPRSEPLICVMSEPVFGPVSQTHFSPVKVIGRGGFSDVVLCKKNIGRKKNTGGLYAVKIMRKSHIKKEMKMKQAFAELSILAKLSHPFIVTMHWAFQTVCFRQTTNLYIVLDFCPGGELFFHLHNLGRFSEDQARFYFSEILLAIEYLHNNKLIYRDLKPENVLLDLEGHVRITDFGLGKTEIGSGEVTHTYCGSPEYMSPEMLRGAGHGHPVDFYCLGALLYEMLTGLPPFFSRNRDSMFHNILNDPVSFPSYISSSAKTLLSGLLEKDPRKRLGSKGGAKDVKTAKWLKGVPWDRVLRKGCNAPLIPSPTIPCFCTEYTNSPIDFSAFSPGNPEFSDDFAGFDYSEEDESTVLETMACSVRTVPTTTSTPASNLSRITPRDTHSTEDSVLGNKGGKPSSALTSSTSPVSSRPVSRTKCRKTSQEQVRLIDLRGSKYRPVVPLSPRVLNVKIPTSFQFPRNAQIVLAQVHENKASHRANVSMEKLRPPRPSLSCGIEDTITIEEPETIHKVPASSPTCLFPHTEGKRKLMLEGV